MLSLSASFREVLHYPPERDGFVAFGSYKGQWPMHRHAELEINLVLQGSARYLIGNPRAQNARRYDLRRNSLVWLFPEQDHVLLDRSPDYRHWIAVFRPEALGRLCRSERTALLREANPPGRFCRCLPEPGAQRLHTLLAELAELESGDTDRFNAGLGYGLLCAWALYQAAEAEVPAGNDVHPAVEKAVRLLRSDAAGELDATLSVAELGRRCGLSGPHLARRFRRETGLSLVGFRNRERVNRFLALYGSGRRTSVLDAALAAGFGSYPQFHRVFKDLMGVSPAEYRRQMQQQPSAETAGGQAAAPAEHKTGAHP